MLTVAQSIYNKLEEDLSELDFNDPRTAANNANKKIKQVLSKLNGFLNSKQFADEADEIEYFKTIQPQIFSHFIFYCIQHKYFVRLPSLCDDKMIKQSCKEYLRQIKLYITENQQFIIYYKSGSCIHDHIYFLRGNYFSDLMLDECFAFIDNDKTTGYDLILGRYLAYERLNIFFNNELESLKNGSFVPYIGNRLGPEKKLTWTDKKNGLVELLYALKEAGCINNGNSSLDDIAKGLENAFNIKLGNFYNTYKEICNREKPTQLLDKLKEKLISKVENTIN